MPPEDEESSDESDAVSEAIDILESKYRLDRGDGETIHYDVDGAPIMEGVYKARAFEILLEGEDPDLEWVIERATLMRLYNQITDNIDRLEGGDNWENQVKLMSSDDVLLFFTLADELVRGLSGQIIDRHVSSNDRKSEASLNTMTDLDHEIQMDILYYGGYIDEGVKGELTNIHKTRNKLVHDLRSRHYLEGLENLESRLNRALDAINAIFEIAEGRQAFSREAPFTS